MSKLKRFMITKKRLIAPTSALMTVGCTMPAWASGGGSAAAGITDMLSLFTQIAAWLWDEIGLFCTFVFSQPLLMLAFAIPFIGLIVNFFVRIFKTA